jgi:type II secretory pathway pseudopilin PulG
MLMQGRGHRGNEEAMKPIEKKSSRQRAFTRIELLALLVVLVIVAGLVVPWRARATTGAGATFCLSNFRQLIRGWSVYSADNLDAVVPTGGLEVETDVVAPNHRYAYNQWCMGSMQSFVGATNAAIIEDSLLYPYVRSLAAYRCPADTSRQPGATNGMPTRVRSYSMNGWMNAHSPWDNLGDYQKVGDLRTLSPAGTFVILEEAPQSINDGWFVLERVRTSTHIWIDAPAALHAGAGVISFGDGHCEARRWTEAPITALETGSAWSTGQAGGSDLTWLEARGIY